MNDFEKQVRQLDSEDPLKSFRSHFALPKASSGNPRIYFCNNSLGLPASKGFEMLNERMQQWSQYGAEGWFHADSNWYGSVEGPLRSNLAVLLGASANEVAVMNSLTVNLHLMMASFYRPTKKRFKIVIDAPTFPSDLYAVKSQICFHGLDPEKALLILEPRNGEHQLRLEDIEDVLEREGESIALFLCGCVNFLTGQVYPMEHVAALARRKGCVVGFDVAHAAGNVPLKLHDWDVDFAIGCSYKYLCSGPGGPGFAFVHERHHGQDLPRLCGWWGNDPSTRFRMQLQPEFIPYTGAQGWQLSTPSILAMTPLVASLEVINQAHIHRMRAKSILQTSFLLALLEAMDLQGVEIITPKEVDGRGCQVSLLFPHGAEKMLKALDDAGVTCDFRAPNVIRVTPSPLYNTFYEIYDFARRFQSLIDHRL